MAFEESIKGVRSLHSKFSKKVNELSEELKNIRDYEKLLSDMEENMTKGWPAKVFSVLEKKKPELQELSKKDDYEIGILRELYKEAKNEWGTVRKKFPGLFSSACKEAGLEIEQDSRHPLYHFRQRFLVLEINETKGQATLKCPVRKLGTCSADIGAVVELLKSEISRLFERKPNGKAFLDLVRKTYLKLIKSKGAADGDPISIRELADAVAEKKKKDFRIEEFVLDLSWIAGNGPLSVDGRSMEFQQTKDDRQGILLHGMDGRGMVGFVLFKETGK